MTAPHKAKPDQWAELERYLEVLDNPIVASAILELRDRLAAAEQRIQSLVDASPAKPDSSPAPASGLVERVQQIIGHAFSDDARSAILAVAEWLDAKHGAVSVGTCWLREEVERHD